MIHAYRLYGKNIIIDVYSGSVHVVDDVAFEAIKLRESMNAEQTAAQIIHLVRFFHTVSCFTQDPPGICFFFLSIPHPQTFMLPFCNFHHHSDIYTSFFSNNILILCNLPKSRAMNPASSA